MHSLKVVDLGANSFTDVSVPSLRHLIEKRKNLKQIILQGNPISSDGQNQLKSLRGLRKGLKIELWQFQEEIFPSSGWLYFWPISWILAILVKGLRCRWTPIHPHLEVSMCCHPCRQAGPNSYWCILSALALSIDLRDISACMPPGWALCKCRDRNGSGEARFGQQLENENLIH